MHGNVHAAWYAGVYVWMVVASESYVRAYVRRLRHACTRETACTCVHVHAVLRARVRQPPRHHLALTVLVPAQVHEQQSDHDAA